MLSTSRADSRRWQDQAACVGGPAEHVPGPTDEADPVGTLEGRAHVLLAKKVCATCPAIRPCLAAARRIARELGPGSAQGVWAGLTLQERETWRILKTPPRPCDRCGLLCVPVNTGTATCRACKPRQRIRFDDYREAIVELVERGLSGAAVADLLGLDRNGVTRACRLWGVNITGRGSRGRRPVKECGTLAAKTRHARRGESWNDCACKHVRWVAGKRRGSESSE